MLWAKGIFSIPAPLYAFLKTIFLCHIISLPVAWFSARAKDRRRSRGNSFCFRLLFLFLSCSSSSCFLFLIPSLFLLFFDLHFLCRIFPTSRFCSILLAFALGSHFPFAFLFLFYFASSGPIQFGWVDGHLATNIRARLGATLVYLFSRRSRKGRLCFERKQNRTDLKQTNICCTNFFCWLVHMEDFLHLFSFLLFFTHPCFTSYGPHPHPLEERGLLLFLMLDVLFAIS